MEMKWVSVEDRLRNMEVNSALYATEFMGRIIAEPATERSSQ